MTALMSIPILLTPDLQETKSFGTKLGFVVEVFDAYAVLTGHGIELHYSFTEYPEMCLQTSCYIRGEAILDLHGELVARAPESVSGIDRRDWGMTEFYVHDPHGNLWKFGMRTEDVPANAPEIKEFQHDA